LIIRLSSIGDILLTTPFIRQVRKRFPQAQLEFVVKKQYADLLAFNPHIDVLYQFDNSILTLKRQIHNNFYEYIFDLHNNMRSIFIRYGLNCKQLFSINKDKFRRFILVYFRINLYSEIKSIPQRYQETGREAVIVDDQKGLDFYWDKQTEQSSLKILSEKAVDLNKPILCIAPGAGFFTKRWPLEYFDRLIRHIINRHDVNIIIIGSPAEAALFNKLQILHQVYNFAGSVNLIQTGYIISKSILLLSNDSGMMHMATAVGTDVVAIFGSSVKELGFYPYRGQSVVIENEKIDCRPCSHIGRKSCPQKHFKCMVDIKPARVYESIKELLQ